MTIVNFFSDDSRGESAETSLESLQGQKPGTYWIGN